MAGKVIRAADRLRWESGTFRRRSGGHGLRGTREGTPGGRSRSRLPPRVDAPVNGGRRHRAPPRRDGTGRSGRPPPCASASPSAPGSGGRATTRTMERLTSRPAAEQPGRLRPRAAWAGWASAARPLRLPRLRPDTTAAPAWRSREPGRRAWAAPPGVAWQRQPPRLVGGAGARGVGGALRDPGASPRRNGRHREGPARQPPAPQGVPSGGTAPGDHQLETGGRARPDAAAVHLARAGMRHWAPRLGQPWRAPAAGASATVASAPASPRGVRIQEDPERVRC
jgi:hypothetical protein